MVPDAVIYMPFAELVDIEKEIERLKKEQKKLGGEIKRCEGMLNNERFLSKAPEQKVEEEKEKLSKYRQMLEKVEERLGQLVNNAADLKETRNYLNHVTGFAKKTSLSMYNGFWMF